MIIRCKVYLILPFIVGYTQQIQRFSMAYVTMLTESCCVYDKPKNYATNACGIIPYRFDCWADLVVHFLLKEHHDLFLAFEFWSDERKYFYNVERGL